MATISDSIPASSAVAYVHLRNSPFRYVPGFLYILVLYIALWTSVSDPRAPWEFRGYHLSWVELLMVAAAMMAIAEQLKVSHPGIDNTVEAILMAGMGAVQVLLFALGAAGVGVLHIFNDTEFLLLTLISLTQAVIGILINARTMRRSIDIVPG
jgi:hypothetical protein